MTCNGQVLNYNEFIITSTSSSFSSSSSSSFLFFLFPSVNPSLFILSFHMHTYILHKTHTRISSITTIFSIILVSSLLFFSPVLLKCLRFLFRIFFYYFLPFRVWFLSSRFRIVSFQYIYLDDRFSFVQFKRHVFPFPVCCCFFFVLKRYQNVKPPLNKKFYVRNKDEPTIDHWLEQRKQRSTEMIKIINWRNHKPIGIIIN